MIEFFTALMIYYTIKGEEYYSPIWFKNYAECEKVLRTDAFHNIYDNMKDVHIACEKSDEVSNKALRPKARPKQ
mgnify:CR=1 FL=1